MIMYKGKGYPDEQSLIWYLTEEIQKLEDTIKKQQKILDAFSTVRDFFNK